MATSGFATAYINKNHQLLFEWSRTSYSNTENYSIISWVLTLDATTEYGRITSGNTRTYTVVVDGNEYKGTTLIDVGTGESRTLASGSTKISHTSWDTSESFSYSFSQEINISFNSGYVGTVESKDNSGSIDGISPKTYTITFNGNGGTPETETLTKTHGINLTVPNSITPTRTGYNFVEWNTKADGSEYSVQPGGSITADESKTMYAIWKIAASVITLYLPNESGVVEKKRGMVHMYNSDGNLRYAIMTIYDDTGKGYLAN